MTEFYKAYRPKTLKGLIGQESAIASLQSMIEKGNVPHFLLLSGPSGCGKTTVARIMKTVLQCDDADFIERNCADFKGIDTVREIRQHINLRPMAGPVRIHLIDEAHKLTPDAQEALLKMLEDTPSHAYFILATTDPVKLKKAIHTRATEIVFQEVSQTGLMKVIERVVSKEALELDKDVIEAIAEHADGSPRKALVLLEQVCRLPDKDAQINAIKATTFDKDQAIELCRELIFGKNWIKICGMLKAMQGQEPEGIRYCVLGYANSVLIGKTKAPASGAIAGRCFKVLEIFGSHFYDSKIYGVAAACYEVIHG